MSDIVNDADLQRISSKMDLAAQTPVPTQDHRCPHCGYCPHCGQSKNPYGTQPYWISPDYHPPKPVHTPYVPNVYVTTAQMPEAQC